MIEDEVMDIKVCGPSGIGKTFWMDILYNAMLSEGLRVKRAYSQEEYETRRKLKGHDVIITEVTV